MNDHTCVFPQVNVPFPVTGCHSIPLDSTLNRTHRLVLHEIDHLQGRLYVERLAPGDNLISIEDYHGTSAAWQY